MTLMDEPKPQRLRTDANAQLDRHFAKQRADQVGHRAPPSSEAESLRGVPVIGPGCGAGAIRESAPEYAIEIVAKAGG